MCRIPRHVEKQVRDMRERQEMSQLMERPIPGRPGHRFYSGAQLMQLPAHFIICPSVYSGIPGAARSKTPLERGRGESRARGLYLTPGSRSPAPGTARPPPARRSAGTRSPRSSARPSGTGLPGLPAGGKPGGLTPTCCKARPSNGIIQNLPRH